MNEIILSEANFEAEVSNHPGLAIVDFWAEWCGPCKVLSPIVAEIAEEMKDRVKVGKVNVDEHSALAGRFNIMSIPTLKFFKAGKLVSEMVGAAPKASIIAEINKYL